MVDMVSGAAARPGQIVIEDIKTVAIGLMVVFVLGAVIGIVTMIGSGLDGGFAQVDGARVYTAVAGLAGEEHAFTRLQLPNDYDTIEVRGETLTLEAGFLDEGSLDVELPDQYTYDSTRFSGKEACVIKRGMEFTVQEPPCM